MASLIYILLQEKKKKDKFTMRLEDLTTPLSITDRSIRFKKSLRI